MSEASQARVSSGNSFLAGVVEGFYGQPWSDENRRAYARILPALGLNTYLYCPKADPYLRRQWHSHWPADQWRTLCSLAATYREAGLLFGVGLSPFALYRAYGADQRDQLRAKVLQLCELDMSLLAVLFDDMPGDVPDLAERQAEILADVQAWAPHLRLLMCPTYYSFDPVLEKVFGAMPASYWERLGALLPAAVEVFWTGNRVCSDAIGRDDLAAITRLLGRAVMLWDNYPVNDGASRSRHLYLYPLEGRELAPDLLSGHLCNPMNQALASLPALSGLAALYGGGTDTRLLARELGEGTWNRLRNDRERFLEQGLDGIGPEECQRLARAYAGEAGEAAREVAAWLRGEYTFDPACLTD